MTPRPGVFLLDDLVSQINRLRDASHREAMTFIEPREFKHHNQEEMEQFMTHYSIQYPEITKMYQIGSSVQGKKLWVLEISDNPGVHEPGKMHLSQLQWVREKWGHSRRGLSTNLFYLHIFPAVL